MVVYSKELRNKLLSLGYRETKAPERNIQNPKYYVFFFEDSDKIKDTIRKYKKEE